MKDSEREYLKTAIINNNDANILELKEKYKDLIGRKISDSELDGFNFKRDELSNLLIPGGTINESEDKAIYCIKTRGDGNGMFGSVSVWLVRNQSLLSPY